MVFFKYLFLNDLKLDRVKNHLHLFFYFFCLFLPIFYYFLNQFVLIFLNFNLNLLTYQFAHHFVQILVSKICEGKNLLELYFLSNQNYHQIMHQNHQIMLKSQKQEPIKAYAKSWMALSHRNQAFQILKEVHLAILLYFSLK
jgi:hypothetical protein